MESVSTTAGLISSAVSPRVSATIMAMAAREPPISVDPSSRLTVPSGLTVRVQADWPPPLNQKPEATPRPQFHHVADIAPTVYELLDIQQPRTVNGIPQDPVDGISMKYSLNDAAAPGERKTQFFDIMGSRGIYHDGWMASAMALADDGGSLDSMAGLDRLWRARSRWRAR